MALARIEEIGPTYDILVATRDGSTLACKNKDGQTVNLSQLAFMCSINPQNQQHEETELQHKDQLIQLSSPNLIDREFDQWPQVSQGNWSGGMLQRIFTGATPITGGAESDPTRFWSGTPGLIWPLNDYLPMQPYLSAALPAGTGTLTRWPNPIYSQTGSPGCAPGFMGSQTPSTLAVGEGFFQVVAVATNFTTATFTTGSARLNASNFFGNSIYPYDYCVLSNGNIEAIYLNTAQILVRQITTTNNTSLADGGNLVVVAATVTAVMNARLAAGNVGNQGFLAAAATYNNGGGFWNNTITLVNTTSTASAIALNLPTVGTASLAGPPYVVTSMCFLGDQLVVALSDFGSAGFGVPGTGSGSLVIAYNIAGTTFTTLAQMPGVPNVVVGNVGGTLFLISQSLDLFLLQGASLQYIATLPPPSPFSSNSFQWSVSRVAAFGPYALFAVAYQTATTTNMDVWAYDTIQGRLFKIRTLSYSGSNQLPQAGFQIAAFSFWQQSAAPAFNSYFSIAVPIDDISGQANAVQILHFGVLPSGVNSPLPMQQGTDIISSLIDFTSASTKLYRDIATDFTALASDALATIRIRAWLDQDPANLNAFPDFDTGTITGAGSPGIKTLSLPINKVAKKLVYEATTSGGTPNISNTWIPAPKLQAVSIQAATGWTRTMMLDLSDNVAVNSNKTDMCWDRQSTPGTPAVDGTAAYNFLRQLWRLQGGKVAMTFPNGDATANWLLQDIHFDSPKPFGTSMRADNKSSLSYLCTVKCREDV